MQGIGTADDQGSLVGGRSLPGAGVRNIEGKARSVVVLEAPHAFERASSRQGETGGIDFAAIQLETAEGGVGSGRQVKRLALLVFEMKDEIMAVIRRIECGIAHDAEDRLRLLQAGCLLQVDRRKRRQGGFFDRWQRNDDDRLGIVEGRRHIELGVHGVPVGRGQGRNVLILGAVQTVKNTSHVKDGAHVGAVVAGAGIRSVGELGCKIGGRAGGELGDDRGILARIDGHVVCIGGQALGLLSGRTEKTVLVDLEREAACQCC